MQNADSPCPMSGNVSRAGASSSTSSDAVGAVCTWNASGSTTCVSVVQPGGGGNCGVDSELSTTMLSGLCAFGDPMLVDDV